MSETGIRRHNGDTKPFLLREEWIWIMGSLMLIAAVMVSLASGVLVAYGVCYGMFQVFRIHSLSVKAERERATMQAVAQTPVLAE